MELVPLARMSGRVVRPEFDGFGPLGRRVVAGVRDIRWEGERLSASQHGDSAADWMLLSPDGVATFDVRMTLRTDDGAHLFVQYCGRAFWPNGLGSGPAYCSPLFETADPRYAWLNSLVAVGRGRIEGARVDYKVFEVR